MIKEIDCRRPDWQPGAEVMMADGQAWHIPRPRLVHRMMRDPATGALTLKTDASAQGESYAALIDRLDAEGGADDWFTAVTTLCLELLAQNYDLPDEAIPQMFTIDLGSEINTRRWNLIGQAIKGIGTFPKA